MTVKEFPNKRTSLPIVAGILTIIAACACLIAGIIGLIVFALSLLPQLLIQGAIAVLAFAFGLTSGIMSLKRRHFAMTAFGICLIVVAGFVNVLVFGVPMGFGYTGPIYPILMSISFGLPILVLSILSIIFIFLSRKEFLQ
ncbi:MAG: hypothetical protein WBV70_04645 [Candidatus Bathyarchaeia archaeon]